MFLIFRTKGRAEQAITTVFLNALTIYRPGLLDNRRNDERLGEKILSYIPFITKIESRDMGATMVERAVQQIKAPRLGVEILENEQIKQVLRTAA